MRNSPAPPYVQALAEKLVAVINPAINDGSDLNSRLETVLIENSSAVPNPKNAEMDRAVATLWKMTREEQEFRFPISPDCVVRVISSQAILSKSQIKAIAKALEVFSDFFIEEAAHV